MNSIFENNFAAKSGGAISAEFVKIFFCHFDNNLAGDSGGALHLYIGSDYGDIDDGSHEYETYIAASSFNFNHAGLDGGAIYCQKYPRKMDSLVLLQTSSNSHTAKNGGFLYLSGCFVSIIANTDIVKNQAEKGGAINAEDSRIKIESASIPIVPVQLTIVTLADNIAENGGGALFLVDSNIETDFGSCLVFNHNMALRNGGAIYVLE